MWSHYANEHRGICLGFSMYKMERILPSEFSEFSEFWPYTDKQLYYGTDEMKNYAVYLDDCRLPGRYLTLLDKLSMVKAPNWKYENEFRFMYHDKERKDRSGILVDFDSNDLENVIYGLKCPKQDQKAIRNIIEANGWSHARYWRTGLGTGLFDLTFENVT